MKSSALKNVDNAGRILSVLSYPHFGPLLAPWKPANVREIMPTKGMERMRQSEVQPEKRWKAFINHKVYQLTHNLMWGRKKNGVMKKTVFSAAMVIAAMGSSQAQQTAQQSVSIITQTAIDPRKHQPVTADELRKKGFTPVGNSAQAKTINDFHGAVVNTPTNYIHGEDKYIKQKEEGKRYDEFQVYDIKDKDKDQVILGLLTNTLDRGKRYDDKGNLNKQVAINNANADAVKGAGNNLPDSKLQIAALRFKDKMFVIIGDHDYRYMDGKRLVGDQKLVEELIKGKPVTETTFFYELQNAGIVDKGMTVTQFAKMNLNEKQRILNSGDIAGNM